MSNVARKPMSPFMFRLCMLLLLLFIVAAYIFMKGNPLTKIKIDKAADLYVQQTYPEIWEKVHRDVDAYFINNIFDVDEETGETVLDDGMWYVYYSSDEDRFLRFSLRFSRNGKLIYDGCKEVYLQGGTIYEHYSDKYRSFVLDIHHDIYNNGMPKAGISISSVIGGTRAEAYFIDVHNHTHYQEYAGPILDVNKEYTMEELAAEYGHMDFNYDEDAENRTMENLHKRRLEMRDIIDVYNIPVKTVTVSFRLFEGAYNMPAEALYSDNLMEILEEYYVNIYEETY